MSTSKMRPIQMNLLNLLVLCGLLIALPSKIKSLDWFTSLVVTGGAQTGGQRELAMGAQNGTDQLKRDEPVSASPNSTSGPTAPTTTTTTATTLSSLIGSGADQTSSEATSLSSGAEQDSSEPLGNDSEPRGGRDDEQPADSIERRQDAAPEGNLPQQQQQQQKQQQPQSNASPRNHRSHRYEHSSDQRNQLMARAANDGPATPNTGSNTPALESGLEALLNRDHHHAFNLNVTGDQPQQASSLGSHNYQQALSPSQATAASSSSQSSFYAAPNHRAVGLLAEEAQNAYAQMLLQSYGLSSSFSPSSLSSASLQNAQLANQNNQLATSASELSLGTLNSDSAGLNTALIQNLTAGLFPVSKLPLNGTLQSLNELLNRTRQQQQQGYQQQQQQQIKLKQIATPNNQQIKANPMLPVQSQLRPIQNGGGANNYLEALLGDQRFGPMLELFQGPNPTTAAPSLGGSGGQTTTTVTSQFGFREPMAQMQFVSAGQPRNNVNTVASPQFQVRKTMSNGANKSQQQPASKQSNVYNTYLPLTGSTLVSSSNRSPSSSGPATNGQMLKMAASLYDQYLDQNYRQQQQQQQQQSNYQFVQQTGNRNNLDKVVYHSTPFRPSIVSPPSLGASSATSGTGQQTNRQAGGQQRPRTEADVKSVTHATLGGNYLNGNVFNYQPQPQPRLNLQQNNSSHGQMAATSVAKSSTSSSSDLLQGPQLLLDLYERAIDSQIQEAIHTDHQRHLSHLDPLIRGEVSPFGGVGGGSASSSASNQIPMSQQQPAPAASSANSHSDWPFDDGATLSSFEPMTSAAVAIPNNSQLAGLRHNSLVPGESQQVALGHQLAAPQANPIGVSQLDPLAAALSELPTFSSSDLQPLMQASALNFNNLNLNHLHNHHQHQPEPSESISYSLLPPSFTDGDLQAADLTSGPSNNNQLAHQLAASQLLSQLGLAGSGLGDSLTSASLASSLTNSGQLNEPKAQASLALPILSSSVQSKLPNFLTKLHTGQLSGLLARPVASFYANLPPLRNKLTKAAAKQQPAREHLGQATNLTPATIVDKQQVAAINQPVASVLPGQISGGQLSPLQIAILQAQLMGLPEAMLMDQSSSNQIQSMQQQQQQGPFGLAGGGISPLIWRNVLSPIIWARRQTLRGAQGGGGGQNVASQNKPTTSYKSPLWPVKYQAAPNRQQQHLQALASINPLGQWQVAANSTTGSQSAMLSSLGPQLAALVAASEYESQTSKMVDSRKPQFRIKIIKIPVAYYDTSGGGSQMTAPNHASNSDHLFAGSEPTSTSAGDSISSLLPLHLQPAQTSALLASLACNHNQRQAPLASAGSSANGGATSNYLLGGAAKQNQLDSMQHLWRVATNKQQTLLNQQGSHSASTRGEQKTDTSQRKPLRDFTDINQPNDLQVSPSGISSVQQQQSFRSKN